LTLHRHPNLLVLSSNGGDVYTMCACIDLLSIVDVTIIATGACFSAAVPILGMGRKRSATRLTRFLVHPGKAPLDAERILADVERERDELARLEKIYAEVLGQCTRRSASWWAKKSDQCWAFGVEEALKVGLIDEIV
jgi:ATP-dependent protease ClpP protease subunit